MIKIMRDSLYELSHSLIYKIGLFVVIPLMLVPLAVYMDLAGLELQFILLYIIVGLLPAKMLFDLAYFKLRKKIHCDLTKEELINSVEAKSKLTKEQAGAAVDALLDTIGETLDKGDSIGLVDFGIFEVRKRAARKNRLSTEKRLLK